MKNSHKANKALFACCIVVFITICVSSCGPKLLGHYPTLGEPVTDTVPFVKNQIILWKPAGVSDARFREIIDSLSGSSTIRSFFCTNCDSSLVRLESPDIANGLGPVGQLASGGTGGGIGPSGNPDVFWGRNFNIKVNDFVTSEYKARKDTPSNVSYTGEPVVVAIFDSGIDPTEVAGHQAGYVPASRGCLTNFNADKGWNFPNMNSDVTDNYMSPHKHGANVTSIILDKVATLRKAPVQILPIKFISEGTPNLFDVLCGLAYAKNRGANIINASFGYYSCLETDPSKDGSLLFKNFLNQYTNSGPNKIFVVAAAGNKDDDMQRQLCKTITRDLDEINFYPASFAKDPAMSNIIVATTVGKRSSGYSVSPNQNQSASVVDVGVIADDILGDKYAIRCPRMANSLIEGSSYATPVLTALIASYYRQLPPAAISNKNELLGFLRANSALMGPMNLTGEIRYGLLEH